MSEQEAWHDWSKSTWLDSVQRAWADELQEYYRNEDWRELDVSDLYPLLEKADARIRELEAQLKAAEQQLAIIAEGDKRFDYHKGPHERYGPCDAFGPGGTCAECERVHKETARQEALEDGALWSFFRSMLTMAHAQQMDYAEGRYKNYEEWSAHIDATARDYVEKFRALSRNEAQAKGGDDETNTANA